MKTFTWAGDSVAARSLAAFARTPFQHPWKPRIARLAARTFCGDQFPLRSPAGTKLKVNVYDLIGQYLYLEGAFEPRSLALALELMEGGGVFLDIGANLGLYTFTVGSLPGVSCISVDASAKAFTQFMNNLAHNPQVNTVAVNVALGAGRSLQKLEAPDPTNLGASRIGSRTAQETRGGCIVAAVPLNELLEDIGKSPIKLMKIDVEGYEWEVFSGLDWHGKYRPENVIMEYSDLPDLKSGKRSDCLTFLQGHGYAPFTVDKEAYKPGADVIEDNLWLKSAA